MDMEHEIPVNSDVRVERLTIDEMGRAAPMIARAYGFPQEAVQPLVDLYQAVASFIDFCLYLAYLPESDQPVAFATSVFPPDSPIVVLQGAATLPEHRGRGLYSTLVAHRLCEAREAGAQAAVIQANRASSAPIVAKLGFEELVPLTIYAWDPVAST